jgi:transcriptional regulator with XRE-family HTH domain
VALFFDKAWFDARLRALSLSRAAMAEVAGLSEDDLTLIMKDQMEVTGEQVQAWARLLNVDPEEIARRCGVSTTVAPPRSDQDRIASLERRVANLEDTIRRLIEGSAR